MLERVITFFVIPDVSIDFFFCDIKFSSSDILTLKMKTNQNQTKPKLLSLLLIMMMVIIAIIIKPQSYQG